MGFWSNLFGRRRAVPRVRVSVSRRKPTKRIPKKKAREVYVVYDDEGPNYSIRELARVEAKSGNAAVGRFLKAHPGRTDSGVRAVTLKRWESDT